MTRRGNRNPGLGPSSTLAAAIGRAENRGDGLIASDEKGEGQAAKVDGELVAVGG